MRFVFGVVEAFDAFHDIEYDGTRLAKEGSKEEKRAVGVGGPGRGSRQPDLGID